MVLVIGFFERTMIRAVTFSFVFFLSSCAITQDNVANKVRIALDEQTVSLPENWQSSQSLKEDAADWVSLFSDKTLRALIVEAQTNNNNLAVSAANVVRARALALQAGAALLPSADLSASSQRSGSVNNDRPSSESLSTGIQVSWELDLWGRLAASRRSATASLQAVEADNRYARHSLSASTIKAYLAAVEAKMQIENGRSTVEILEETLRIVDVRYRNGMNASQDVALAKADLATAQEALATYEGSFRDAVRALELLLGRYPSADTEIAGTLPALPAQPPAGIPSEVLERRPDLIAAERRVAAAFDAVNQTKAARMPTLGLTSSLGGASDGLSSLLDSGNVSWMAGANLLAPLFDGGRRKAQVEIATAEQEQALANYAQAALTAFSEVESALDQGVVAQTRERYIQEAAISSNEAYRIAKVRYEEGEGELIDLLAIQQRVNSSNRSQASIKRARLEHRVNLYLALGGAW